MNLLLAQQAWPISRLRTAAGQACLMAFDRVSAEAVAWAEQHAAELVTSITAETREGLRRAISRAFADGIAPREAAKIIKQLVGLRPDQVDAVLNVRKKILDAQTRAAATGRAVTVQVPGVPRGIKITPKGLPPDRVSSVLTKYAKRQLRQRALLIARTETIAASNAGQQLQWAQAVADGLLRGNEQQRWVVAFDERLCPICRGLHGQQVPLGQPFISSIGPVIRPPAHPNCRCTVVLAIPSAGRR